MTTVWAVYFSGTGTTERTVTHIAGELARLLAAPCRSLDFTRPQVRQQELNFCQSDLVVLGTPVYAGRVPNVLLPFLREKVRGGGALAVPVVLLILLLFVADYLLSTKVVRGRFRQVALALALSPLLLVGIELAVNQFLKGAWQLTWSLIVSVPCLILALLVLVLDRRQRFKEEMRKRLHM